MSRKDKNAGNQDEVIDAEDVDPDVNGDSNNNGNGRTTRFTAGPPPPPPPTDALNTQIVQAVDKTNAVLLGAAEQSGSSIAYQKVAQAAAYSVQDATDYMRNTMAMAGTAQGVCLQKMIAAAAKKDVLELGLYAVVLAASTGTIVASEEIFKTVGKDAGVVAGEFPSSS